MSETIIPEVQEPVQEPEVVARIPEQETSVVPEQQQEDSVQTPETDVVDYSGKTLPELSELFHNFATSQDRLQRAKEAEAIKSAFYKTLLKEKEKVGDAAQEAFNQIEENFKALYASFKKEKAAYARQIEAQKEENLKAKLVVVQDLKALLEKDEDATATFPEFRAIQNRWREIGAVPVQNFRDLNNTYQLYVEQFYDKLKISHELRDLDFKKNYEAKLDLCEKAEQLAAQDNSVDAFRELQKLHDAWKDLGPVAKQYREEIWDRFKAATAIVNKKYQGFFEEMKDQQAANLEAKAALCEKVEEIAAREIADSRVWNALSKEIESIQAEWRKIGFASKKENQKIYDRFRAACDSFFARKRDFYTSYKDDMEENIRRKVQLCEEAEQLKLSKEWKKATDQFIALQKQWKEIGAVPRKKSDQLWKRFRAACDEFFAEKEKNAKPAAGDYYANLKAKQQIIANIEAYVSNGDAAADEAAYNEFADSFAAIGFVPFKEKENVSDAFKAAMAKAFPSFSRQSRSRGARIVKRALSEKDALVAKYRALEQEIATKENNILFFARGKAGQMLELMQAGIDSAKEELKAMEAKIRQLENEEQAKLEEEENQEGNNQQQGE